MDGERISISGERIWALGFKESSVRHGRRGHNSSCGSEAQGQVVWAVALHRPQYKEHSCATFKCSPMVAHLQQPGPPPKGSIDFKITSQAWNRAFKTWVGEGRAFQIKTITRLLFTQLWEPRKSFKDYLIISIQVSFASAVCKASMVYMTVE